MVSYVDVIEYDTDEVVKTLGPYTTERLADEIERVLGYQIDHQRFYTQIRKEQ